MSLDPAPVPPAGPQVTMAAAAAQSAACSAKEATRVVRRAGDRSRWKRAKMKEPMQKDSSEVPDLIQRVDWVGAARPRPM